MDQLQRQKRALEIELRNALQSIQIVGAEALVRWNHPSRGSLSPAEFIGIAEERGVIGELGLWVLEEACRFAAGSQLPWIAVNVSPLQFDDPDFADSVFSILTRQDLPAGRLELEITEGLLLENSPSVREALAKLRSAGVRIALDDFGTGYSSISHLRDHSDKLKIDQSFTRRMGLDKATGTIVRSVIEMARALGMSVTAEGVEDDLQLQRLRKLGCSSLQGYLLSRPIGGDRLIEMIGAAEQPNARPLTSVLSDDLRS